MSKIAGFGFLWWLTGSPLLALLLLAVLLYVLDRRYIGILPNVFKPLKTSARIRKVRQELALQPHSTSLKSELAGLLIDKKRYAEAAALLEQAGAAAPDSADAWYGLGLCRLKLGALEEGERLIGRALELNGRLRYGEPYLRLGEALARTEPDKALDYLRRLRDMQSSSCEVYFRLGLILERMGRGDEAKEAYRESAAVYKALPKYKRKSERRWFLLSAMKR